MTKEEFNEVLAVVNSLYPNAYDFKNPVVVRVWAESLIGYDKLSVEEAIKTRYRIDSRWLNFGDIISSLNGVNKANRSPVTLVQSDLCGYWYHNAPYDKMCVEAKIIANERLINKTTFGAMSDQDGLRVVKSALETVYARMETYSAKLDLSELPKGKEVKMLNGS